MNITLFDKFENNKEILCYAGLLRMMDMNTGWTMADSPRQFLYSQLWKGKRNLGKPRLRFKDIEKRIMEWEGIAHNKWQLQVKKPGQYGESLSSHTKAMNIHSHND